MHEIWENTDTGLRAEFSAFPATPTDSDYWQGRLLLVDPTSGSARPSQPLGAYQIGPFQPATVWAVVEAGQALWREQIAAVLAENADARHLRHTEWVYERGGADPVRVGLEIIPSVQGFRWALEFWWPGDALPRPGRGPLYVNWRSCVAAGLGALQQALTDRGADPAQIVHSTAVRESAL